MVNVISTATELGYLNVPNNIIDRNGTDAELSAGEIGVDHDRKSGRGDGCIVPYGSEYPS